MGNKYSEVTITCLSFTDGASMESSDGSEAVDGQDILMGVNYIEKVSAPHIIMESSLLMQPRFFCS